MGKIKRALVSVSDKTGLVELGQYLQSTGVEILSTGGTARALREAGVAVKDVSEHTGFPEMMDGRLKTLHPKVHGGLLGRRDNPRDLEEMKRHGIEEIDMVVVNLYPFEQTVAREGVSFDDAIENIDIGGPTMLRAAAKNFRDVAVVVDPRDYQGILDELRKLDGRLGYKTRYRLARKVFEHTARYDALISQYLRDVSEEDEPPFPETLTLTFRAVADLPSGENRHQRARAYAEPRAPLSVFGALLRQGGGPTFRQYMDIHAGIMLLREFDETACAIVKHATPCGVGVAGSAEEAFAKALRTDTVSAYGGMIGFGAEVDAAAAERVMETLAESVLAPSYTPEALAAFARRPGLNVIELEAGARPVAGAEIIRVAGGVLVQDWDMGTLDLRAFAPVTRRHPTDEEYAALAFAWKVCKHVRSDAVVYALADRTLGIGGGQPSRVFAARVGAINAQESLRGSVVASDGLIPSAEAIEGVRKAGATAIVQPGGFEGDERIIAAADEFEMAMVFTGMEHFKY